MTDTLGVSGMRYGCAPPLAVAAILAAVAAILLCGCEPTGPKYDPETTCAVDSASATIICRDKP